MVALMARKRAYESGTRNKKLLAELSLHISAVNTTQRKLVMELITLSVPYAIIG